MVGSRNFTEIFLHSSPSASLFLLASLICCALFAYRAWKVSVAAFTDGVLFISAIAFIGFLLFINLAQAIHSTVVKGIDSDLARLAVLENLTTYSFTGAILVGIMTVSQLFRKR